MNRNKPSTDTKRLKLWLIAATAIVNTALLTVLVWALHQDYANRHEEAQKKAEAIAHQLELNLSDTAEKIYLVLSAVQDEIAYRKTMGRINLYQLEAFRQRQKARLPELITLVYIDQAGKGYFYDQNDAIDSVDLSDRGYFRFHQQDPSARTRASKPHFGRIAKEWVLPFSQRINSDNGKFGGVVLATVRLSYINWLLSQADIGAQGVAELRHQNLTVIVKNPKLENGEPIVFHGTPQSDSEKLIQNRQQQGTFMETSPYDGIERITAIRKIGNHALYVRVGLSTRAYLRQWYANSLISGGLCAAFLLITILFAFRLHKNEKKRAETEAELKKSHNLLTNLSENAMSVIYQFRMQPDGKIDFPYISSRVQEYLGFSQEEVYQDASITFSKVHPDDLDGLVRSIKDSEQTMQRWENEWRTHPKPGITKWLYGTSVPCKLDDGSIVWHGFFIDISERKAAEQILSMTQFSVDHASLPIMWITSEGRFQFVNDAACHLLGYTKEEFANLSIKDINKSHTDKTWRRHWEKLKENKSLHLERTFVTKDNKEITVDVEANFLKYGDQEFNCAFVRDITEKKKVEEFIWHQANFDATTELPNRSMFYSQLELALKESKRSKTKTGLLLFDLDNFKEVNDTHGHDAGDLLLKTAAERLRGCVHEPDVLARLGGDEFVVIFSELSDTDHVERVAACILESMSTPFDLSGKNASISSSIGIAIYPENATDLDDLVRKADKAMYEAKWAGKNQMRFSNSESSE